MPSRALLAGCQAVQTLDLLDSFSTEHYQFDDCFGGGCGYDEDAKPLPYDEPLMACVRAMRDLKEIELGNGSQEMSRYLFDYSVSRGLVYSLMGSRGLKVTMSGR